MIEVLKRKISYVVGGLLLLTTTDYLQAQDQEPQTIKVKKESNLVKAVYDNVEERLIAIDRFGNPKDNRILSYTLYVKSKKETKTFKGFSNSLSAEMLNYLSKLKSTAKLFFNEIMVEDDGAHPLKLPDVIEIWFPQCTNCDTGSKRK